MRRENKQELVIPMEGEHTAMVLSCVKVAAVEKRKEAAKGRQYLRAGRQATFWFWAG